MSNDEYQHQMFLKEFEGLHTEMLSLEEIMERYPLTDKEVTILKSYINDKDSNNSI